MLFHKNNDVFSTENALRLRYFHFLRPVQGRMNQPVVKTNTINTRNKQLMISMIGSYYSNVSLLTQSMQ